GLRKLRDQTSAHKSALEAALKACQPISEADEEWLDNAGNLVNEEHVVDQLDRAADFGSALKHLDASDRSIVQELMELAGKKYAPSTKKCPSPTMPTMSTSTKERKATQPIKQTENASLEQQIEILNWHYANGKNQTRTASHFNEVHQQTCPNLVQPRMNLVVLANLPRACKI
ncbi:hypothetical protein L210DRAFT_858906, partial [Boletus edulis BED1]